MFAISFANVPVEYPYDDPSASAAFGELILGDANPEGFVAALAVWDKSDYEAHWKRELKLLLADQMKVTLIVDLPDLLFRANTEVWDAYLDGHIVYFHNRILWGDNLPTGTDPAGISQHTPDRAIMTEEGHLISEWAVSTAAVLAFLQAER